MTNCNSFNFISLNFPEFEAIEKHLWAWLYISRHRESAKMPPSPPDTDEIIKSLSGLIPQSTAGLLNLHARGETKFAQQFFERMFSELHKKAPEIVNFLQRTPDGAESNAKANDRHQPDSGITQPHLISKTIKQSRAKYSKFKNDLTLIIISKRSTVTLTEIVNEFERWDIDEKRSTVLGRVHTQRVNGNIENAVGNNSGVYRITDKGREQLKNIMADNDYKFMKSK